MEEEKTFKFWALFVIGAIVLLMILSLMHINTFLTIVIGFIYGYFFTPIYRRFIGGNNGS